MTRRFLYDGDVLVQEQDGSGAVVRRYAHGEGLADPILASEGGAINCTTNRFPRRSHPEVIAVDFLVSIHLPAP